MANRVKRTQLLFHGRGTRHKILVALAGIILVGVTVDLALGQGKPVIKVVAMGGTISHTLDGRPAFEQVIADIRETYPETTQLLDSVHLDVINVHSVASSSMSGDQILDIVRTVNKTIQESEVRGVIVTHGTVVSEETAYFLHLLVKSIKPVVLTNSQRRHGTVGNDGDKNFLDSIRTVLSPDSAGKGVLVVHNETINSAREVIKTSGRPGAFRSGEFGILGLAGRGVAFYRGPTRRHTINSEFDIDSISTLPKVAVISAYYDADPALIQAAVDAGVKGIVVSGFTSAGIPFRSQVPLLESLADKGLPVVLTARGGMNARIGTQPNNNFIGGDTLVAYKARLLLQLALSKTSDLKEIQRIFNEY